MAQGDGDREDHSSGVAKSADHAETLEQLDDDQLEEPAVGLPGLTGERPGEGIDARNGVMLQNPLAGTEMPPNVGVAGGGCVNAHERGCCEQNCKDYGVGELFSFL